MKMLNLSCEDLRCLCIENEWFTCGTNKQYEKLFNALEAKHSIGEIATIIWLCSDDCWEREGIRAMLQAYEYKHVQDGLPDTYAEIEYPDMDSAEAIDGARFDDLNYRHYTER